MYGYAYVCNRLHACGVAVMPIPQEIGTSRGSSDAERRGRAGSRLVAVGARGEREAQPGEQMCVSVSRCGVRWQSGVCAQLVAVRQVQPQQCSWWSRGEARRQRRAWCVLWLGVSRVWAWRVCGSHDVQESARARAHRARGHRGENA